MENGLLDLEKVTGCGWNKEKKIESKEANTSVKCLEATVDPCLPKASLLVCHVPKASEAPERITSEIHLQSLVASCPVAV